MRAAAAALAITSETVDMQKMLVARIGSGSACDGTLYYRGGADPFSIGNLGIRGIGAFSISAEG
jgi:hypothetical protein